MRGVAVGDPEGGFCALDAVIRDETQVGAGVIGAFGVARTIAFDVEVGQPIFAEPSEQFRKSGKKEAGEPHSSYHEYLYKLGKIKDRLYTSSARELAEGRQKFLATFFEQMLAEARGER